LRQWFQYESPFVHQGMGYDQMTTLYHLLTKQKNVKINDPCLPPFLALSSHAMLNMQEIVYQLAWKPGSG
jgi:hypothetical protein